MDFQWQWWVFDKEDSTSHDPVLLNDVIKLSAFSVFNKRPLAAEITSLIQNTSHHVLLCIRYKSERFLTNLSVMLNICIIFFSNQCEYW